jgi:gephyrin
MPPSLSIPQATAIVLSHTQPLGEEEVAPLSCLGRVLAQPLVAPWPHPPFPASIKDGFAVRSSDCPGELQVVAACRAGEVATGSLGAGETIYITTGAPLPPGADAVVGLEEAHVLAHAHPPPDLDPSPAIQASPAGQPTRAHAAAVASAAAAARIRIACSVSPGAEFRAVGSDHAQGAELVPAGSVVGPAEVGLAAMAGGGLLHVHRRPLVGVLSTGDELLDPLARSQGEGSAATPAAHGAAVGALPPSVPTLPLASAPAPPPAGFIYDANRPALLAAVASVGASSLDLGVAADGFPALENALDAALASGCHVLVTSGGVSMGSRDLLGELLQRRGSLMFDRVMMKPGKPLTFAVVPRHAHQTSTGQGGMDAAEGHAEGGAAGSADEMEHGGDAPGAARTGLATDAGGHAGAAAPPTSAALPPLVVFGLPGNPVSALVCFSLVVAPALRRLAGVRLPLPRRLAVFTASALKLDPERPEYNRATLHAQADGLFIATSTGRQISSRLVSCAGAHALLELPRGEATLPPGTRVSALLMPALSGRAADDPDAADMLTAPLPVHLPPMPSEEGLGPVTDQLSPTLRPHLADPVLPAASGAGAAASGGKEGGGVCLLSLAGVDARSLASHLATRNCVASLRHLNDLTPEGGAAAADGEGGTSTYTEALGHVCAAERGAVFLLLPPDIRAAAALLDAARAAAHRHVPSLASLLRGAYMVAANGQAGTGSALVRSVMRGEPEVFAVGPSLLVTVPAPDEPATAAAVGELLPMLAHACAQLRLAVPPVGPP